MWSTVVAIEPDFMMKSRAALYSASNILDADNILCAGVYIYSTMLAYIIKCRLLSYIDRHSRVTTHYTTPLDLFFFCLGQFNPG